MLRVVFEKTVRNPVIKKNKNELAVNEGKSEFH